MKSIPTLVLFAGLSLALTALAADPPPASVEAPKTNSVPPPAPPPPAAPAPAAPTNAAPAPITVENGAQGILLNFRGAPLNLVLDYLSDAAGFVINKKTEVRGSVEVWSKAPVSQDEAVALLNSVLKQNGYGVTRNGRILTIFAQETAKTADLDIVTGNDPDAVEKSDEVVTQIIPVRYASVSQLTANLEVLLPTSATLSANESANTLILVATKTDIKRMLKIINALDTSIASVSSIKVIPLQYADAKETANLITQLFTSQGSTQSGGGGGRGNLFNMFGRGGGPGGMFGGFGGGGAGGSTAATGRTSAAAAATKVTAVGDDRSNSLILSAPADLLGTITEMVEKIDQPVTDLTEIRVFHLVNADPTETANQLSSLFPDETTTSSSQNNVPFFMRGPMGGGRSTASSSTDSSERAKKMGKVVSVADPRTSSLIVTASKSLMPQIAEMIAELDSSPAKKEVVKVFELQNADPADVYNVLQDLFNRNTVRSQSSTKNTMLGNNNPLSTRQSSSTSATSSSSSSSSMGSSSRSMGSN